MANAPILVRGTSAQYIYSGLLASIYRSNLWLPPQGWAEQQDVDVWAKIRRDPVVEHAISQRLHSIASRSWRVAAGGEDQDSQRLAEMIERVIEEIDGFTVAQYQLAQAILLGRSYSWINGTREPRTFDGVTVDLWVPHRLEQVDPRRFRFRPRRDTGGDRRKTDIEMATIQPGVFKMLTPEIESNFVKVVYDDEEGRLGYGRGILDSIYFYHYAKGIVLREGLAGIERWAQGLKVIKPDPDREASTGKTNDDIANSYMDVIEKSMARNTLVMHKGDDFEIHWPSGEGNRIVLEMLEYLDKGVTQLVLGSVLPTGGGADVGSNARARVEEDSSESLKVYDRQVLDQALTRDLIGQFMRLNAPQLARLGLANAKKPKLSSVNEKRQDPQIAAQIVQTLLASGIKLRADEVYEKTGFTKPKPGEELIEGQQAGMGMDLPFGESPQNEPSPEPDVEMEEVGPSYAHLQRRLNRLVARLKRGNRRRPVKRKRRVLIEEPA